jgi:hypothetical protein
VVLVGKHGDVGDVGMQCRVAIQHEYCSQLQASQAAPSACPLSVPGRLSGMLSGWRRCTTVQLHQGPGALLLRVGPHIGPVHGVCQAEVGDLGVTPEVIAMTLVRSLTLAYCFRTVFCILTGWPSLQFCSLQAAPVPYLTEFRTVLPCFKYFILRALRSIIEQILKY